MHTGCLALRKQTKNMANRKPVVLLFRDDFKRVKEWVKSYPDRETGGQMFGLWTHDRNPYINIITGPGKNCRHGTHSFHQDIDYLKSVGTFLNKEFMMCHIGEWHSHHRLRLRQPSSGDLNSIWKHFPAGLEYFLLIIATIEDDGVRLNPWFFTASSHTYDAIEVKIIEKDNVFMNDDIVKTNIFSGAETAIQRKTQNPPTDHYPSTQMNTTEFPVDSKGPWFQTDRGGGFVQLLHSKLEEIIDASTDIEKTLNNGCLQFSFQRNNCSVFLIFPTSFPRSALKVVCKVPGASSCLEWEEFMGTGQEYVEFVDQIVRELQRRVPSVVINNACVKYVTITK